MAQRTIYECNHCKKEIGKNKHISIQTNGQTHRSGIANPPDKSGQSWNVLPDINSMFMHFCDGKCIGTFFSDLMKTLKK